MPLYEYQCDSCGGEFEKMVRFSEFQKSQECPYCKSHNTQKQLSKIATRSGGKNSSTGSTCRSTGPFR